jgi:hypothetical protein
MKLELEPGWKWSKCIKPIVGTESCEVPHINYVLSDRLQVITDDGIEKELNPHGNAFLWIMFQNVCQYTTTSCPRRFRSLNCVLNVCGSKN